MQEIGSAGRGLEGAYATWTAPEPLRNIGTIQQAGVEILPTIGVAPTMPEVKVSIPVAQPLTEGVPVVLPVAQQPQSISHTALGPRM